MPRDKKIQTPGEVAKVDEEGNSEQEKEPTAEEIQAKAEHDEEIKAAAIEMLTNDDTIQGFIAEQVAQAMANQKPAKAHNPRSTDVKLVLAKDVDPKKIDRAVLTDEGWIVPIKPVVPAKAA